MSEEIKWPQVPPMANGTNLYYSWHHVINNHCDAERKLEREWPRWMYDAKHAAENLPLMAHRFKAEREGTLPKVFRKCSCCSEGKHVEDNHLTCCLGVECRICPHLLAFNASTEMSDEEKDWAKAWTCAGHILSKGGDMAGEGFLTTVDDRMFWDSVYYSLAQGPEDV